MEWLLLSAVTLLAAILQSATGFGFGLLAVSAFLMILESASAIQLVIIITLLISCLLWPSFRGQAPKQLLSSLILGSMAGFPIGAGLYLVADLNLIKLVTAAAVLLMAGQTMMRQFSRQARTVTSTVTSKRPIEFGVGLASGTLASALAMPGPVVMAYLARLNMAKDEIRALIMTFFIFAYGGALVLQQLMVGIEGDTWLTALKLSPAAILGLIAGHFLTKRLSQQLFQWIILTTLMTTGIAMLISIAWPHL